MFKETATKWKQYQFPSTYKWVNKMFYMHTWAYYLAIEKNVELMHATKEVNTDILC